MSKDRCPRCGSHDRNVFDCVKGCSGKFGPLLYHPWHDSPKPETRNTPPAWIGVDLDGTLAKYDGWKGPGEIGEPIPAMLDRVKRWLTEGKEVRILTARVSPLLQPHHPLHQQAWVAFYAIQRWCNRHVGQVLPITSVKDLDMIELWDDRAVQVTPNTGVPVAGSTSRVDEWLSSKPLSEQFHDAFYVRADHQYSGLDIYNWLKNHEIRPTAG